MASYNSKASSESQNWVWVPNKTSVFRKGHVLEPIDDNKVKIRYDDGSDEIVLSSLIGEVNPNKFDKADDIADLTYLNEASVLHNLDTRYKDDLIYTYSGLFLVAINPYNKLPIYSDSYINMYHDVPKADTKPHIFAETEEAYQKLLKEHTDQSILVTGESGAGKTENTKKIIQYLAAVTSNKNDKTQSFEQQIIQANPILESFGNSQTVRNNNSSRFGKFIKIEFDEKSKISGAHIDWYLLEKSRVVSHSNKERNYHIFYQLLAGLSEKELDLLGLERSASQYNYLKDGNFTIPGVDDKKEFKDLKDSLNIMGVEKTKYYEVFKLIAVILHIGNIEFSSMKAEQASFQNPIDKIAELLGVSSQSFSDAILRPKVKAGKEFVKQSRNATQAKFSLDALSKSLYEKVFKFLVDAINQTLDHSSTSKNFIGVLDIAGFEIFRQNSFEQLCINYTNEKLQQFFNHHMFVLEQNEYLKEDIDWKFVDFGHDLQQTIDLIEKQNPIGIFSILDEECIVPKSSDTSFFEKLNQYCSTKSQKFKPSKFSNKFTLKHYAGDVEYSTEGWIDKNRDPLFDTVVEMLSKSSNNFISNIYADDLTKRGSSFRTVAQRHKEQLTCLLNLLSQTHPHFVRCIIPNHNKKPQQFDKRLVLEQLKCNGVLEGIRIVRSGFPNRIFFKEFYDRYKVLASDANFTTNIKANCQMILSSLRLDQDIYKVGSTKVFFKAGVLAELELKRDQQIKTTFTDFNSIIRGVLRRRKINLQIAKIQASRILAVAFKAHNELDKSPWYKLYANLKPLLSSSQQVLKTKQIGEQIKELEKKLEVVENERGQLTDKHASTAEELTRVSEMLQKERASLQEKDGVLVLSKQREDELEQKLQTTLSNFKTLEAESQAFKTTQSELETKLKLYQSDLDKGKKLVQVLEKDKVTLTKKIKELENTLHEMEDSQKTVQEKTVKIQQEVSMLRSLLKTKDTQIQQLENKLSSSHAELEAKVSELTSNHTNSNKKVRDLIDQNKSLTKELKYIQDSSSQFESIITKKEVDLQYFKTAFEKQAIQVKKFQEERDSLLREQKIVSKELSSAKAEADKLKVSYKQLEHEANEARKLLQMKISDEITFNRGKQKYDGEILALQSQIKDLESSLENEKLKSHSLNSKLRETNIKLEDIGKDRKAMDVFSAQGAFHSRSLNLEFSSDELKDDKSALLREYASVKLQLNEQSALLKKETIEKNKLKTDLKLLHTRLASETFDKQQLKIKLSKIQNGDSVTSSPLLSDESTFEKVVENNAKLQRELESLKIDFELERKASQRSQSQEAEKQRKVLQERNTTEISVPVDLNSYKTKYEESQAKVRLLERSLRGNYNQAKDISSIEKPQSSLSFNHDEELLNVYQETARKLNSVKHELSSAKSEISSLEKSLDTSKQQLAKFKTKDVEELSNQLAREELTKVQLKLQAIESKNSDLSQSVKLYKSRSEEFYQKLENAETAIRSAKFAEKFAKDQLDGANETISDLNSQCKQSENAIVKLRTTISHLKEQIESKDADLAKWESNNRLLREEIQHYQERLLRTSTSDRARFESQMEKMNLELAESLRHETDLRKSLGSLELEFQSHKEQKSREIRELTKEKTIYLKMANELKEYNEESQESQKDLEIKLRSLMKQIGSLNESVDSLIIERDSLQTDKRRLESTLKEISSEYSKFENERDVMSNSQKTLKSALEKYESEIEALKIENKRSRSSNEQLNSLIDDERQKIIILTEENQSLGRFSETLKKRIATSEEKLSVNNDELWIERIEKLEKNLQNETAVKLEMDKEKKGLERSVTELKSHVDRQQKEIVRFDDTKSKYESKISELFNAIHKWQTADATSKLTIKRAEREIRHLQEHSNELERELKDWQQKFDTITTKKKSLVMDEVFV